MNSKVCVLIPAAGKGRRMTQSVKKPYLKLAEKPILAHTLQRFEQNSAIDAIFVIVDPDDFHACRTTVLHPYPSTKVQELVAGGATRQRSVYNGIRALDVDVDFVIVHDAVRPFVTDAMIFDCLTAADECGAAVAAVPVKDTIKVADADNFILETPAREQLWAVQTPQVFRKSLLETAHREAEAHQLTATDDAALVEKLGFPVKLVNGSYANLKITTPIDLQVAEVLITDATLWE